MRVLLYGLSIYLFAACGINKKLKVDTDSAESIVEKMREVHGASALVNHRFEFEFRKGKYAFQFNEDQSYYFESKKSKDQNSYTSILTNKFFEYYKNDQMEELDDKKAQSASNALNSVIYFASLPYKLHDESVYLRKLADQQIKGKDYYQIEVSFSEEGGGTDYDDVFHYWINKDNFEMDYLAYVYHTGKGGVRFRSAFNKNRVEGVLFQDYKNYKAPKETALQDLPALFESGQLNLLSEIKTENVMRK